MKQYNRDMHGYGATPPHPEWPNDAAIAVQFVVNYEEGGERCLLHGDDESEAFLSEVVGASSWSQQRHWNMETIYEYGARAGFWRLHRAFTEANIPVTVFGVTTALERSPAQLKAMLDADWEIACHGLKWIEHKDMAADEEKRHIINAIKGHETLTGAKPHGWYTGRCSMNTVDLVAEHTDCIYQSDSYADDLPYWQDTKHGMQLIVPYTLDTNDMRFATPQGFNAGDQFFNYLKDSFDALYNEGLNGQPKMLNIGLHCRLAGRPGRIMAVKKFIDYAQSHDRVWFAKRVDIARHWRKHFPAPEIGASVQDMTADKFMESFGHVFEHSPWIAQGVWDGEIGFGHNSAAGMHQAMITVFRNASHKARKDVLLAHPDLAGKLAKTNKLTAPSTEEQNSAGLDRLSDEDYRRFTELNTAYREKFGFPFIIAVKGLTKDSILKAFETRVNNSIDDEFTTACLEVEKIALLRLRDILGK